MCSNIPFVVVAGSSQDASGMSRTYRRPPVRCEIAAMCATDASQLHQHNQINASASISLTNRHDAMTGAMLFCNLRKYDCLFSFFLGTRHHHASAKSTASFGRALWKMHVCANNCKPKTQRLVTCSRAWHARENNSAQRKTGQMRLGLNLTSWCAARHLLRFFSVSVALAGVWLVRFKWRWDYKHIYCNGLACSPSSLLWLVKCGLTDMELQSEALCRNWCCFLSFQ